MGPTRTSSILVAAVLALAGVSLFPASALAQPDVSLSIEKHARLTTGGAVVFRVRLACGPLPGSPDFRQSFSGATQSKIGAAGEGGLSPDVVCDGFKRSYTAALPSITAAPFRRGVALANAAVIACNVVGDSQVCVNGSTQRRIIISGRRLP